MSGPSGFGIDELLRQSQERMAKVAAVREQMAGLTGQAATPDGRIEVVSTSDDPLAELTIDPRAMRMGSAELAAAIRATARQARSDLDRQAQEISAAAFGDDNPMDALRNPDELKQSLSEVQGMFGKAGKDAQSMIEQLRRGLGFQEPGAPR